MPFELLTPYEGKPDFNSITPFRHEHPLAPRMFGEWIFGKEPLYNFALEKETGSFDSGIGPAIIENIPGYGNDFPGNVNRAIDLGPEVWLSTVEPWTLAFQVCRNTRTFNQYMMLKTDVVADPLLILFSSDFGYADMAFGSFNNVFTKTKTGTGTVPIDLIHNIGIQYNGEGAGTRTNYRVVIDGVVATLALANNLAPFTAQNIIGRHPTVDNSREFNGQNYGLRGWSNYRVDNEIMDAMTEDYWGEDWGQYILSEYPEMFFFPVTTGGGVTVNIPQKTISMALPVSAVGAGVLVNSLELDLDLNLQVPTVGTGAKVIPPELDFDMTLPLPQVGSGTIINIPQKGINLTLPVATVATGAVIQVPVYLFPFDHPIPGVIAATPTFINVPLKSYTVDMPIPTVDIPTVDIVVPALGLDLSFLLPTTTGIPVAIDIFQIDLQPPDEIGDEAAKWLVKNFLLVAEVLNKGARGSFIAASGETVIVSDGIVRKINEN